MTSNLEWAHPLVREWFFNCVGTPTEPQVLGWPPILEGKSTLISAPTGSGKTFAAFLTCIDQLVRQSLAGTLLYKTEVLYISPLKALGNDIQKNLMQPLLEIQKLAENKGFQMKPIVVAVRTGDTPQSERTAMLKKPPHILVTTPESLYILLTARKSRHILSNIKTIIVDEIHALADNKRGAHLSLSLERLNALTNCAPTRIGLSATIKPIKQVAQFLIGNNRPTPVIIQIGHVRHLDLYVEVPSSELSAVASNEMWDEIYDRIAQIANKHRSVLVFANTRRIAERAAHHLSERLGKDKVTAHHGSLSKKLRLSAETKLKNGELKVLVATASLELGIDIGSIDVVCQLGSPRSIAIMLQRIGRSGHWHGATSKGYIFATTRDELIECAALAKAIIEGELDQLIMVEEPLDILAQQIAATCATDDWVEVELYNMVKHAFPYRSLSKATFNRVIAMLSEGISGVRGRFSAHIFRDQINGIVKARKHTRIMAIMNGGAIPENGLFTVLAEPTGGVVGTLDEDFAVESNRGDIILLGSTSWKIKRVESSRGRVLVEDAHGALPSVPFWRGEAPERTAELSLQVSNLRIQIQKMLQETDMNTTINWLINTCKVDTAGAEQMISYITQGFAILGAIPSQQTIIAERFFDESGGMQLVIHAPFGARINKAWGLALRKCFCRSFNIELQAQATDNGINISLTEQHSFPLADVFNFLNPKTITKVLTQAAIQSPIFTTRWRWDSTRSLAVPRFRNGKKIPPNIIRMLADDLLTAIFPDAAACQDNLAGQDVQLPSHPLIDEVLKDTLTEALNLDGLIDILKKIKAKSVQCIAIETQLPSSFAHEILNANPYAFLDDTPLEERRARAVEMRRILPDKLLQNLGKLDAEIIKEVESQAWPDVRSADELHDVLQTLIAFPVNCNYPHIGWNNYFQELLDTGRVGVAKVNSQTFWFAMEKKAVFATIYPSTNLNINPVREEDSIIDLIKGWMFHIGPINSFTLSELLLIDRNKIDIALTKLESTGLLIRGNFTGIEQIEWCERRLLARIHRQTIGKLRKEIKPVSAIEFVRWLYHWQHVANDSQLTGERGLISIIKQLQGFEIPAKAWEKYIFSLRIKNYNSQTLDQLCLMGIVGWARFSAPKETKRIIPTSIAPITFFIREDANWLSLIQEPREDIFTGLSSVAKNIYDFLKLHGASFFTEIVSGVKHLKSEVELGLWELVTAGLTTADSFDNLRSLIDPKRRLIRKRRHPIQHQYSTGRWSLLKIPIHEDKSESLEALCWVLLQRYGVVFREIITRENLQPRWRELLLTLRRLEDRGEIRGGRFVDGFLGEQFALPYAIESMRASKNKDYTDSEFPLISAADPLNVVGFILPGERIPALSKFKVSLTLSKRNNITL